MSYTPHVSTHIFTFLFFFYCSGHHRDLHSFPTRRSSDLSCSPVTETRYLPLRENNTERTGVVEWMNDFTTSRSEEHTSELQSRLHLVCRLLLEKKKKKKTVIP